MLLFVKQYKQEVLGVGEVALPGEGGALSEAAIQRAAKEAKERSSDKKDAAQHQDQDSANSSVASSTNGTEYNDKTEHVSGSLTFNLLIMVNWATTQDQLQSWLFFPLTAKMDDVVLVGL